MLARSTYLHINVLSLSEKLVLIEECEIEMYNLLTDLGFDVITCPLRSINEFGGGIHCSTLDIRRNDEMKDYFPDQDYEKELEIKFTPAFFESLSDFREVNEL